MGAIPKTPLVSWQRTCLQLSTAEQEGWEAYHVHKQIGSLNTFPRVNNILQGSVHPLTFYRTPQGLSPAQDWESLHVAELLREHHASYSQPGGWEVKEEPAVLGKQGLNKSIHHPVGCC